ncbi:hypothetical protein [Luteolibacter luteus]|uniref:Uncharacterized protein n=1 Tax=Luteolibacter luteus TaxID=2728835 RepID=A0A858RIX1_9BACT|nr:hypothetical protein [Luteolibacter luteus]QJE96003.1 hypothetical protein HHL09_09475 [Luteolibacter luteus]
MTSLQIPAPTEKSQIADCEVGDWIPSSRVQDWNKKLPTQEYASPEAGKPWLFIRGFGKGGGTMQTLWKRVE